MLARFVANYIDDLARNGVKGRQLFRPMIGYIFAVASVAFRTTPINAWSMFPDAFYPSLPAAVVLAAGSFCVAHAAPDVDRPRLSVVQPPARRWP